MSAPRLTATVPENFAALVGEGAAILRYQDQLVEGICKAAVEQTLGGHRVLAVNTCVLISEVASKLAEGRPFGAAWFQRSDGKRQWSLRSRDGGVDVSEIARAHGGGGHRNAAGFEDTMPGQDLWVAFDAPPVLRKGTGPGGTWTGDGARGRQWP